MPRLDAPRPVPSRWSALAGAAALLAGCALVVRHQVRKAEAANPPRGRFVEVEGGLKLHFIERGDADAPVLVMLHGNGGMAEELVHSGLVGRAAMRYRVLAFDRPGYGHSDGPPTGLRNPFGQARLIEQALDRLDVREALVFGHSWGTLVALALALQAPQRVRALVLAAGYYRAGPRADVAWLSAPAVPGLGTLMRHTISPLLSRLLWPAFCWRMFSPREVTEPFRSQYPVWMSLRPRQLLASAAESALMIPSALKLQRRYGELRMPLVIVGGDTDRMLSTDRHAEFLHEAVPGSRLHVLPGAGHMVHHVATHSVMKAIDEAAVAAGHVTPQQRARAAREAPTLPAG
jgi:pimeloyl-ACP methyl ester carboxylesterase